MRDDPYRDIQAETTVHRRAHGCGAYPYHDGSLLGVIAASARAHRIVEVGTALGYSALWLAYGAPDAHVDTIEADPRHVHLARENLVTHGASDRVTVLEGRAEAVLETLSAGAYDVAFFDGFEPTPALIVRLRRLLRDGGVLIAANLTMAADGGVAAELGRPSHWLAHDLGDTALAIKRGA